MPQSCDECLGGRYNFPDSQLPSVVAQSKRRKDLPMWERLLVSCVQALTIVTDTVGLVTLHTLSLLPVDLV